jgi:hypothetical protein
MNKLNNLLTNSDGIRLYTSKWLNEHGYYKQLVKRYCDNGWLSSIGHGAYTKLNEKVSWLDAVNALQDQLNLDIHVGGLTSLGIYGVTQYVTLSDPNPTFYLYNTYFSKVNLPKWFQNNFANCHMEQKKLFDSDAALSKKEISGVTITTSSPERAILEVLSLVPNKISLSHAFELMEMLHRLRLDVVQDLLNKCTSIKVKRLFLYLSEECNHPYFHEINLISINLGLGKRVIVPGGEYHKKWKISLPKVNEQNDLDEKFHE